MAQSDAPRFAWLLTAVLSAALVAGGCDSGGDGDDPACSAAQTAALLLQVQDSAGGAPPSYRVLVATAGGTVHRVSCAAGEAQPQQDGPLRCVAGGAVLDPPPGDGFTLTVKAPGRRTLLRSVPTPDRALPAAAGSCTRRLPLALEALPAFEVKAGAYRTGFDAADGLAAFEALALPFETELGLAQVVKFVVLDLDTATPGVWFQDTRRHPIHYDFVRTVLRRAVSPADFERHTYHGADRTGFAGTLLRYPALRTRSESSPDGELVAPLTLTFFPSDDLTPAQARLAHRLLEERLGFVAGDRGTDRLVYLPAGAEQEQQLATADARLAFAAEDALWTTRQEVFGSLTLQLLNPGLSYGRLRRLTPAQLASEVVSYTDILVLTRLPNELPIVGGTITEELQTPLAHVNVAARTRGLPNIALLDAGADARVAPLLDGLVRFEVAHGRFTLAPATEEEVRAFWAGRHPQPFQPQADLDRSGLPGFAELSFADSASVGVKAANLAELANLLGEAAPTGFAVPFRYYDEYLRASVVDAAACAGARADCAEEGRADELCGRAEALCLPPGAAASETLQAHLERILADPEFAADSALREASLDGVGWLFGHGVVDPRFAASFDARVQALFGSSGVRLRSSTNAEDLPGFSGAGLYRSESATGGSSGKQQPSAVLRKIWGSVWSFQAFEERSYWGIEHLAVRMGVAVHPSYPDEAANGVLITRNLADPTTAGMYVNVQRGETSVTNPEGGALPEIFSILPGAGGVQVSRARWSSLSPGQPLLTAGEITTLSRAAGQVQERFASLYGVDRTVLALDLEFKFFGPQRTFLIKQVRPFAGSELPR